MAAWELEIEDGTMKLVKLDSRPVIALLLAASMLLAISAVSEAAVDGVDARKRVTHSRHFLGDGRENATALSETRDEYDGSSGSGTRSGRTKSGMQALSASAPSAAPNSDFWFYLVDVELYADNDRDGYFSGIDLLFDIDTYYSSAEIYAVAYLSWEGGPWEEYAVTEDFTIFGSSGTDDYVVVTDLVSGYPTGDYDLLIEVFDAYSGEFLAWFGPEDTSELAFLPLEDMERDTPQNSVTRITVNNGGGGSIDIALLALLGLFVLAGRCQGVRRRPASL